VFPNILGEIQAFTIEIGPKTTCIRRVVHVRKNCTRSLPEINTTVHAIIIVVYLAMVYTKLLLNHMTEHMYMYEDEGTMYMYMRYATCNVTCIHVRSIACFMLGLAIIRGLGSNSPSEL
jgi:hypothetical protein